MSFATVTCSLLSFTRRLRIKVDPEWTRTRGPRQLKCVKLDVPRAGIWRCLLHPTTLLLPDGQEREVDVVVAADDSETPSARTVVAIGEAKPGETLTERHLQRLREIRTALGERAAGAKILLFGVEFTTGLRRAAGVGEVELVDLERLYTGE